MNFRVLMQDKELGFQFAIPVEGINRTGSETLAQCGATEEDGERWNAGEKALNEFPDAFLVKVQPVVEEPLLGGFETEYLG